jgi:hypothetical protein
MNLKCHLWNSGAKDLNLVFQDRKEERQDIEVKPICYHHKTIQIRIQSVSNSLSFLTLP